LTALTFNVWTETVEMFFNVPQMKYRFGITRGGVYDDEMFICG